MAGGRVAVTKKMRITAAMLRTIAAATSHCCSCEVFEYRASRIDSRCINIDNPSNSDS